MGHEPEDFRRQGKPWPWQHLAMAGIVVEGGRSPFNGSNNRIGNNSGVPALWNVLQKNNEITNGLLPRVLIHHKVALLGPAFTCYKLIRIMCQYLL
jgi:hypothetical protein